eukprot:g23997.t1
MTIKDEANAEVFVNVVCAIFADLRDSRIRNLFILLLQLMTSKELEQAKNVDDVFQPSSRVFRLFSFFALHRVHFEEVVHPFMDCHKVDEQGQPLTLMGAVTYKTLEKAQTWALEFNRYLESPSIAAKLKERCHLWTDTEILKTHTGRLLRFFQSRGGLGYQKSGLGTKLLVLLCFLPYIGDKSIITFLELAKLLPQDDEAGTEVELKIVEPLFRLFVNGIILPILRAPKKYGGREVGLRRCEKNNFDGDVIFNVCTVLDAFEDMTNKNLVLHNVNKIRVQSGDLLDQACRKIGWWSEQFVKEAMERAEKNTEVLYRLTLQHRFFFTEAWAASDSSKCTVPLSLSSAAGSEALQRSEVALAQNVDVIRFLKEDNPNKVLEDLFRNLPPLKSSNFLDLKEELEGILKVCANEALAEKLSEGIQAVADFIETETSPEEVLHAMASVILTRNRHSRYLHSMLAGFSRLPTEEQRHAREIRSAELELKALVEHSKTMLLFLCCKFGAPQIVVMVRAGALGSDLNFLIKKQAARVKTKTKKKVVRYNLEQLLSSEKVLECYSLLDTVQGKVYVTFWSDDADIMVHVGLLEESDARLEFVKQFIIPEDVVKQLPFADREDTLGLPLEGPIILKWRSLELSKLLKDVPPAD